MYKESKGGSSNMSKQRRIKKLEIPQSPTKPGIKKMVLRALNWFWRNVMIAPSKATIKATGSCQETTVYATSYSVYIICVVDAWIMTIPMNTA